MQKTLKGWNGRLVPLPNALTKALWIMKMTALLMIVCSFSVSANVFSQDTKVTIQMENATLNKFFLSLEKQTSYRFVYSNDRLTADIPVNIKAKEEPLSKVLERVLMNTGLSYKVLENLIVIMPRQLSNFLVIRGKVLTPAGDPLPGVSIRVKGKAFGTATDSRGEFVLTNVGNNAVLVFSSIGYEVQEVPVNNQQSITVTMKQQVSALGNVLVLGSTGYQTISRERSTGSFGIIGKEQLEKPALSIGQRLIGTTAGVQAKLDADGNPTFEIRGQSTLYATAQPLIVVDGFAIQGDFSTINPSDVESVTILKDAAAASIWGARAVNGVIVVTTKSARRGSPMKVEFSAFTRVGKKFDLDYVNPLASSSETVDYELLSFGKWGGQINPGSLNNYYFGWSNVATALNEYNLGFITAAQKDAVISKMRGLDNRQQIRDNLLANPVNQQYNLTISGGSDKMINVLSLLYEANQSNFKETRNKKYIANFRTNARMTKWLDFNFSGMVYYNRADSNGVALADIQAMSPYDMLLNDDGSYTNISQMYAPLFSRLVPMSKFPYQNWGYNPLQEIRNRSLKNDQLNTRFQAGLTARVMKGLSLDTKFQYELFNTWRKRLYNNETYQVRNAVNTAASWDQTSGKITSNLPKGSILMQERNKAEAWNWRNQLNFQRFIGRKHEINFIAGTELNNIVNEFFGNPTTYGYNDETLTLGTFPNGPGGTFFPIKNWQGSNQTFSYTNSFSYRTERYFSAFANAAYTYNNKYTVSGSFRTDASNMITDDPKYRYAPFWSAGLSWQLSKEKFMYNVRWVDRLALRATYGYNGNVDRSTAFKPLIGTAATPNIYTNDFTATISSYGNPTLRWEKTGTVNLGIDYSLFRGKLYGKVDLYNKNGKDLIAQLSIPAVNGTTTQKLNKAAMINRGIELELGTTMNLRGKDIIWNGSLNFSYNYNKVTHLFIANYPAYNLTGGGTTAYVEGKNASTLWAYQYAGVVNKQPMVQGKGKDLYDFTAFSPGDGRDYLLDMGTKVAPYTLGFLSSFKIYDFNLSFIVTGKFGHKFNRLSFNYPVLWTTRVLPNKKLGDVMGKDGSSLVPLPMNDNEPRFYFWDRFYPYLNYLVEDASHIRMQEVNITYTLPRSILQKFSVNRLQFYLQGNDLFTITANHAGEDPEYPMNGMKPQPKLTLGLKLEF